MRPRSAMMRSMALIGAIAASLVFIGCPYRVPFISPPRPAPTVASAPGDFTVQTGVVQAATKHDAGYVRGEVEFPRAFGSDNVQVTIYPIDGPGKLGVLDVNARGFSYFILATIVNVPRKNDTFASHAEFYDGRIKWVAIGR